MFIPDAVLLLCQSLTTFHFGNYLFSAEERTSPPAPGESSHHPEDEHKSHHTQDGIQGLTSSPSSTILFSASESPESSYTESIDPAPDIPAMAYPLSNMRNDPHIHSMGSEAPNAGFSASGYTPYLTHDDIFMDVADPCSTSTPVQPKSPTFSMHSAEGMDTDTSSSTVDLGSPRSDTTTNITTPSTTNGSAFKPNANIPHTPRLEQSRYVRKSYPKPTFCPFFSSPHVQNVERTRELWRHRLEVARRRAMANSLQPARGGISAVARAAELKRKASYIRRMDWIEQVTWDIPSEFEQYMFLLKLQAEEDEREARKEQERGMRDGEDSDGSEESFLSSPLDYGEGEGYSRDQISGGGEGDDEDEDERGDYLEPPPSRDFAEFGRSGEFEEMKMRLDELHRNARVFPVRPLFEEARTFDDEAGDIGHEGDREHGMDEVSGYI